MVVPQVSWSLERQDAGITGLSQATLAIIEASKLLIVYGLLYMAQVAPRASEYLHLPGWQMDAVLKEEANGAQIAFITLGLCWLMGLITPEFVRRGRKPRSLCLELIVKSVHVEGGSRYPSAYLAISSTGHLPICP